MDESCCVVPAACARFFLSPSVVHWQWDTSRFGGHLHLHLHLPQRSAAHLTSPSHVGQGPCPCLGSTGSFFPSIPCLSVHIHANPMPHAHVEQRPSWSCAHSPNPSPFTKSKPSRTPGIVPAGCSLLLPLVSFPGFFGFYLQGDKVLGSVA